MGAAAKKLGANELLFREGDASDAMYVVKTGQLKIFKVKGTGEIELATIGPGQMLGEMAFFDGRPRSASAKAVKDAEVIALPFASLSAQFKTFPEWLKAMVKTVNEHLRDANTRIKQLEQVNNDSKVFPPHVITQMCAILNLVANKFGETTPEGLVVPGGTLRRYTIQVFQQPTNKMQKLIEQLTALQIMKVDDLGEGKQKLTILKPDLLHGFVEFYNEYLFAEASKKVTVEENELRVLRGILFFGRQSAPDDKGKVKISLNHLQNESMKSLGYVLTTNDANSLITKGLIGEKEAVKNELFCSFDLKNIEKLIPFWEIIYTLDKVQR
jgi:CRP/FNR family transcriptional regulator, cyclic AMP receptor protein